ncbi:MAG TPA: YlmC/YmxH family sporulation protein [Bacillota bacterium]|jgi:YlmC/YmxH family sporulation protein|nr:YlmC/YmxH family sporulation protein [Bacillota bacterium]HOB29384.1 YlmC/YmxH family sporulation protein [Bacillota bacterium]HPZ42021.1 YlmC/YmxH family sporulation protein [Bacillota bacterium]HQD52924.1 YlmC/YmxH family sporulation protein [Bacillota bacterium]
MRLSELARKELVDLEGGNFWGPAGKADLLIDPDSGEIKALLLAGKSGLFGLGYRDEVTIPWSNVVKVGGDTIILQIEKS